MKKTVYGTMEIDADMFFEMEAVIMPAILKDNIEYQQNEERIGEIFDNNQNLVALLDWNRPVTLSEEDVKQLKEYLELERHQNDIWRMELYKNAQTQVLKQFMSVISK